MQLLQRGGACAVVCEAAARSVELDLDLVDEVLEATWDAGRGVPLSDSVTVPAIRRHPAVPQWPGMGIADLIRLEVVDEPPIPATAFSPAAGPFRTHVITHTVGDSASMDTLNSSLDDRLAVRSRRDDQVGVPLMSPLSYEIVVRFRSTVTVNGKARVSSSTNGPKITVDVSMVGAVAAAGAGHYERQASEHRQQQDVIGRRMGFSSLVVGLLPGGVRGSAQRLSSR